MADWVTAAEETKRVYMAKQRQQLEEQRARQCEDAERQRAEAAQRRQQQAAAGKWGGWGERLEVARRLGV